LNVPSRGEPAKARPTSSAEVRAQQPGQDLNHLDEQSEARGAAVPHHTCDPTVTGALSLTPQCISESQRRDLEPPATLPNVPSRTPLSEAAAVPTSKGAGPYPSHSTPKANASSSHIDTELSVSPLEPNSSQHGTKNRARPSLCDGGG